MKKLSSIVSLVALAAAPPLSAQDTEKPKMLSPGQIVDQAAPDEWQAIAASDLLIMKLQPSAKGKERQIIIQLMPPPFSQGWVRNIRKLAKANWWDGTRIVRVQDNYVVQWGDPAQEESERKPLPDGLEVMTEEDYIQQITSEDPPDTIVWSSGSYGVDNYSDMGLFENGWPLASSIGVNDTKTRSHWPVHCYGTVGVGRSLTPDTGSGAELYTVIGHAPRHLDRNIAVVGRIIEGMHHLSSLPRGFGPLGFYETPEEQVPIQSIRLASELPAADQPRFEFLSTEGESFAQYANRRANREPPFFIKPAGGADICNISVPVRRMKDAD
ncbi:MAG: peptidylprolyl isomerase [Parasphingorhabdus sp.]